MSQQPYITGYFLDTATNILYLFRNGEQAHYDTRNDVMSEPDAMNIIAGIEQQMATPVPPPVAEVPAPAPVPTPTPTPAPVAEAGQPVMNVVHDDLPPAPEEVAPAEEPVNDLAGKINSPTEVETETPGQSLAAMQAERASNRAQVLKDLGFVHDEQGYLGFGFSYSFAMLNNQTDEYFNNFVKGVQEAIAEQKTQNVDTPPAPANSGMDVAPATEEPVRDEIIEEIPVEEIPVTQEEVVPPAEENIVPERDTYQAPESPIVEHADAILAEEAAEEENPEDEDDGEPAETTTPAKAGPTTPNPVEVAAEEEKILAEKPKAPEPVKGLVTNFFSIIEKFKLQFKMDVSAKDGIISIIITPLITSKDDAFKNMPPITLSGTCEELDNGFFDAVLTPFGKVAGLVTSADAYIEALAVVEAKTKKAVAEKKPAAAKTPAAKKPTAAKATAAKAEPAAPAPGAINFDTPAEEVK